jgi:hypothetical protein
MCGLPPAVSEEEGAQEVRGRGRLGVPLENGTESGGNTPKATSAGRKVLTTPTKCAPFYTSSMTSHISRGAMRVAGVSRGDVMRRFGVHI